MTGKWFAAVAGLLVGYAIVSSWPEIRRYRRIKAM